MTSLLILYLRGKLKVREKDKEKKRIWKKESRNNISERTKNKYIYYH